MLLLLAGEEKKEIISPFNFPVTSPKKIFRYKGVLKFRTLRDFNSR